ncbi:MAG: hypothetical protein N4A41_15020 [Crocinitomicaceae bacterium]|jgi:hypothetical protein|nr:hypothetical protein [Crocinitomicaceae bacterium]
MKRVAVWMLVGMISSMVLVACGSASGAHCDAYSNVDNQEVENSDLASR